VVPLALLALSVFVALGRFGRSPSPCDQEETSGAIFRKFTDRFEIEALLGECSHAAMMRDYDRFASLFTQDGAWRIPDVNVEFVSRDEIRAGDRAGNRVSGSTSCRPHIRA